MKIEKNRIYSLDNYTYKNFILLSGSEKKNVLKWRNHNDIRKWMTNSEPIPLKKHLSFIDMLSERDDMYYWLVFKNGSPVGVVNIFSVNHQEGSSETGYYLNPESLDSGEGFEFYYYFKLFIHSELEISKTSGLMKNNNKNSHMLINYFGGKIKETKQIDGDLYFLMETQKSDFDAIKDTANDLMKFAKYIRRYKADLDKLNIVTNLNHDK